MKSLSRRRFLKNGLTAALAAGVLPTIIPASALGRNKGQMAPSERVALGFIGVGPQGRYDLAQFLPLECGQVVAVCDVYQEALEKTRGRVNEHYKNNACATYTDFRKLLEREDIDAVVIATPDHWHVPIAIAAAKAGKDIYLEKPMGLTLAQDQKLRAWAQKKKRVFQFGTQQRSSPEFHKACELVINGRIGKLQKIYALSPASRPGGSTTPAPAPAGLDYNTWLGPAPEKPCADKKCVGAGAEKTWWYNADYALGFISGWGIHPLDIAHWAHPNMMKGIIQVEGKAVIPTEGMCNTSVAWDIHYTFADGVALQFKGSPLEYNEHNELNDFSEWKKKFPTLQDHGTAFEGSEGWLLIDRTQIRCSNESVLKERIWPNEIHLQQSKHHALNFLEAVKSRGPTVCPIEESVRSDFIAQIGDIATRLGRKLSFDPIKEHFVNDAEANRRAALPPMRKPWTI